MSFVEEKHINNIVHEAETQRQYIRIELPATVIIKNFSCKLLNLSAGGFKVSHDKAADLQKDGQQPITIQFDFNAFSFTIQAEAQSIYAKKNEIAYRFINLTSQQASMIRHVIRSYLSGQIFTIDNVLNVATRDNYTKAKPPANQNETHFHHIGKAILPVVLISLGLAFMLWIIGSNIYESQRFVKSYSSSVEADSLTLRAKENGTFTSLIDSDTRTVAMDQPIGTLLTDLGKKKEILSPCDCTIAQNSATSGEFKLMGEALFKLLPPDANMYVSTLIRSDQTAHLKTGNRVKVRLAGERNFRTGKLVQFVPQESEFMKLKIRLDEGLESSDFGKPAYVEIAKF